MGEVTNKVIYCGYIKFTEQRQLYKIAKKGNVQEKNYLRNLFVTAAYPHRRHSDSVAK